MARLLVTVSCDRRLVFDDQLQFQRGAPSSAQPRAPAWPLLGATAEQVIAGAGVRLRGKQHFVAAAFITPI